MKYIDIICDKIDYLFRRGKTADERCYDFFIRTVTFLLITLIVLCYGSFVNASGNTLISYYNIDTSLLTNPSEIKWNHSDVNKFMNIKMNTSNVDYRNLPSGGSPVQPILYFSPMPDLNSNYVLIEQTSGDWEEIWFIPKTYVDSGQMVLVADGEDTRIYSSVDYTFILYSVNYNDVQDPEKYRLYDIRSVSAGSSIRPGQFEPAWSYHATWSNAPYYLTSTLPSFSDVQEFVNNGMIDDYPNFYNSNYYTFMDDLLTQPWDDISDSFESNANHNYLTDIQIGLTSQNLGQNILSSQVIIGCDVDDWILNNLDDYSLYVNYKLYIKDSYQSSPNDPDFNYSVILPLRVFYNNAYTFSVAELFRDCISSNNQSFQNYFNIVGEGQKVLSEQPYNAIIPCFLETIYQGLGKYYVTPDPVYQTIPYTIFQFKLDVSCSLSYQGMSVDDASGIYLKEFDFKNGSESVKIADILRNNNPWEGASDPQQSPIVPPANNPISGSGSGNVNVNVDVSGQKIPIGVKTKQEINTILENYKNVNDTFMDSWEDLSDPNNDNNFMSFISDETKELPAVDYMIKGSCAIFGLSIILFVLKVLLF